MLRWNLYGAGFENLGRDEKPEVTPLPTYSENELLVRQDACGLCFSDTKVINLGENHPRLSGRDLESDPVTLGHEVACTVVGIGSKREAQFKLGDRFTIQADVFYKGKSLSYGYAFKGGLAEYSVIPREILDGDEGCYLIPISPETGYVEAALTEPWACVVSSYKQTHRGGVKAGGCLLAISPELDAQQLVDLVETLAPDDLSPKRLVFATDKMFHCWDKECGEEWGGMLTDWLTLRQDQTDKNGFDDILLVGDIQESLLEVMGGLLADQGIVNLAQEPRFRGKVNLDIGRIHYNQHHFLSSTGQDPAESYSETRTSDLLPDGIAWIIGSGGPMGQMHLQRAIQRKNPPKRIVATETNEARFASLTERFGKEAEARGVELVALNPKAMTEAELHVELTKHSEGRGFDDIVCCVPVVSAIEKAQEYLAENGWFNLFAGVARGTLAQIDVNRLIQKRLRFFGSSGSSLADMREVVALVERGELSTNDSLAAIGGMNSAKEGLKAVKEGWFAGKTLIFPLLPDLPLTPLAKLKESHPEVFAKLKDGQFWTKEAEAELLRGASL